MRKSHKIILTSGVSLAIAVVLAAPASTQQSSAPIARYTIDAGTTSGMAAMGSGMGGAMSMMFGGGGNKVAHQLELRLGSSQSPTGGGPKADHFMPAGARLGKSVPLLSPTPSGPAKPDENHPPEFQRPKGRLLLFWGCGGTAPKGQPVVIDFTKLAAGQIPPGLFASATSVPADWAVTLRNSRTYGDWPNGKESKPIPGNSSLIGDHRIAGNYSPEIKFSLTQDYLPAITGQSRGIAGGATQLSWNSVENATGYYAWVMGFNPGEDGQAQDIVWWTSSASQMFGGELWNWLSPATVQKLIGQKVVMPLSQTSCTVPAQVKQAAGQMMMGNLYAYGPEANFVYPPRPADPKIAWKPEWTARVRYRSNTMWFINGPGGMGGMAGAAEEGEGGSQQKKKCKGGFGGLLGAAVGGDC